MNRNRFLTLVLAALLGVALLTTWGADSAEAAQAPYQTRLAVGDYAETTPRSAVRVREQPGRFGARLGKVPAGGIVTILDGPDPNYYNNMVWWYVEYAPANLRGWMSEGTTRYRLLHPTDRGTGGADPAPAAGLQIGDLAYVMEAPDNVVRRTPGLNDRTNRVIGGFPPGTVLEIEAGPEYVDGVWWWLAYSHNEQVRGWTAEGQNGELFLAPHYGITRCGNSARTRLADRGRAYVLSNGTGANYLRGYSDIDAAIIGRIPPSATMTIVDGPVCDENTGIVWWEVIPDANPRLRGWTAESDAFDYYLAPLTLY